jgi:5-methylthioadenosine/S-adenosylhomocysteine deaminase
MRECRGRCCVDQPAGSFEEAWMLNRRRLAGLLGATAVGALAAPALITPPFAQVAAPLQRGNYLVKNGAVITVDAAGVLPRADVHVNNGRIEAVGLDLDVAGAETIDATDMIVMPGFIDTHYHM